MVCRMALETRVSGHMQFNINYRYRQTRRVWQGSKEEKNRAKGRRRRDRNRRGGGRELNEARIAFCIIWSTLHYRLYIIVDIRTCTLYIHYILWYL